MLWILEFLDLQLEILKGLHSRNDLEGSERTEDTMAAKPLENISSWTSYITNNFLV